MTTLAPIDWTCPLCGAANPQMQIASTNELGPPDLDMRPGEMLRSTMPYWVRRCPACSYVAAEDEKVIADRARVVEVVGSSAYRALADRGELPELARLFLMRLEIDLSGGDPMHAGWCALRAAWVCDDSGDAEEAVRCRRRALELWEPAVGPDGPTGEGRATDQVLIADLRRRTGDFEGAREACHSGLSTRAADPIRSLLEFEIELIAHRDVGPHSAGEVRGS